MRKHKLNIDAIVIMGLVLTGIVFGLILFRTSAGGSVVQVRVDGKIIAGYSLNEDNTVDISGYGDGSNRLVIQDGYAWMETADCPDGLCINMGKISRKGQSVVCLPNRVVLEIVDNDNEDGLLVDDKNENRDVDVIVK